MYRIKILMNNFVNCISIGSPLIRYLRSQLMTEVSVSDFMIVTTAVVRRFLPWWKESHVYHKITPKTQAWCSGVHHPLATKRGLSWTVWRGGFDPSAGRLSVTWLEFIPKHVYRCVWWWGVDHVNIKPPEESCSGDETAVVVANVRL